MEVDENEDSDVALLTAMLERLMIARPVCFITAT
jgi:hypothetical protein